MIDDINSMIGYELIVALGAFLLSMFLTPIYTTFAYKHKLWKRQKSVAVTGESLTVMNQLHKDKIKRHFPTMAGMIMLVAVPVVLITCNGLNRGQTWLPIVAFVGGGVIGFIDDMINLFGKNAAAGLRAPVKFAMITALGVALGWFFAVKLGWTSVMVPYVGPINIGVIGMIILFAFDLGCTNILNTSYKAISMFDLPDALEPYRMPNLYKKTPSVTSVTSSDAGPFATKFNSCLSRMER